MSTTTPGLVCAHHHLYSELARGMPPPPEVATDFQGILDQIWWRLDTALDLEMIRWSAMLGAVEALESGTTAIVDHHESPNAIEGSLDVIADACAEVGVRVLTAYGITDRNGPDGAKRGLKENERFIKAGGPGYVGIHAAFTCTDDSLQAAAGLAEDLGVGVHIHVAEGIGDVDAPSRLKGLTRDNWLISHCVHLPDDHELSGTILHNPRSNLNNGVGYANPARFSNPVALGTDGIGANVIESFRLAYVINVVDPDDKDPRLGPWDTKNLVPNFTYDFEPPLSSLPAGTNIVTEFRGASVLDLPYSQYFPVTSGNATTVENFANDPLKAGDAHIRHFDDRPIPGTSISRGWWTYLYNRTVTTYTEDPTDLVDTNFTNSFSGPNESFLAEEVKYINWRFVMKNNVEANPPVSPKIESFAVSYRLQKK